MGKDIFRYSEKLEKYNIINVRFSFEYFFKNKEELETLYNFLKSHLMENGYLVSYMIDKNKLNTQISSDKLNNKTYPIKILYDIMNNDDNIDKY